VKLNIEREIYIIDCDTEDTFKLIEICDYDTSNKILTALFRCENLRTQEYYLEECDIEVAGYGVDITLKAEIDFEDTPELVDYSVYKLNISDISAAVDSDEVFDELASVIEEDYSRSGDFTVLEVEFKDRLCM
jgi:hypothetical protein